MTENRVGAGAMTLTDWAPTVRLGLDVRDMAALADALVEAGIAREDLDAFMALRVASGRNSRLSARFLQWDLASLRERLPQMTLRDGLGWALAFAQKGSMADAATAWVPALEADGWVFAAAGLSLAEARAQVENGTADRDALVTLAALRGIPEPRTA